MRLRYCWRPIFDGDAAQAARGVDGVSWPANAPVLFWIGVSRLVPSLWRRPGAALGGAGVARELARLMTLDPECLPQLLRGVELVAVHLILLAPREVERMGVTVAKATA